MVQFITLFLGSLIVGPHPVRLEVPGVVAAIEVRLDQQTVATLRAPPWEMVVDFGEDLAPHLLEAIAHGADGRETGRARQWINFSPKDSEVHLALHRDRATGRAEARVRWQSLSATNEPVAVRATFDGRTLEVGDPRVVAIPEHDPAQLHHLSVVLEFPGELRSSGELVFGGPSGDEVDTELTPIAVSLGGRRELPAIEEMDGWFLAGGRPLEIDTVDKGLAEIMVVRTQAARRILATGMEVASRPILAQDHRLRFVGARPVRMERDQGDFEVFPRSEEIATRVGGLRKTLGSVRLPGDPAIGDPAIEARLVDAVAVAGLLAHRNSRRRAVVLITTGDALDASRLEPGRVRAYLERLGVPLVVWNPKRGETEAGRWGAARNVSTRSLLDGAYRDLTRMLDRQRVVWVEGLHLPQEIALGPGVEAVELVR